MGQPLDVQPGDLIKAGSDYSDQATRTTADRSFFESGARLSPDVWGRLKNSPQMAKDYDKFYNGVVEDMGGISTGLTQFGDLMKAIAEAYKKAEEESTVVTVQPGDTLSGIAKSRLGNGNRWPDIAAQNPQIKDPNLIHPGDKIKLPKPSR